MAKENEVKAVERVQGEVMEETSTLIKLKKPYVFEGQTYESIDLGGLDNLTGEDMIAANNIMNKSGSFSAMPEMSLEYSFIIAARATKLPIEFFKGLHPKDAIKVKNRVTNFFYGDE